MMGHLVQEQLSGLLARHRLLPAVTVYDMAHVGPLGQAFADGGLPLVEITYRSGLASDAIRQLSHDFPALCVGAGTILSVEQAAEALAAGAAFLVSPDFNDQVVEYCRDQGVAHIPGVQTATEVGRAIRYGLGLAKFFPAYAVGGIEALKAMAGPFPDMRFMPTGGVNRGNLPDYLALPNVLACGGTWFAPRHLMATRQFDEITEIVAASVSNVQALTKGKDA